MKKSRRKHNLSLNSIKTPYRIEGDSNSVSDYYQRYNKDENAVLEINGRTYYKIIELYEFKVKSVSILSLVDIRMNLKIDDKLIDENGEKYNVKSFEMFRLSTAEFPDWYLKIVFVALDGDPYKIGDYLAKYQ